MTSCPWIDEGQAERKNMDVAQFAAAEAEKWKAGLAKWDQDGSRIQRFRDNVDLRVYTPGSSAGRPMTILKSFSAPSQAVREDPESFLDLISSAASGILALLGIDADPIRSREHILISNILKKTWGEPRDLDLKELIKEIQQPSFTEIGAMEINEFFSEKDRQELAMTLNNLLASPSFSSWIKGEPLNIEKMLYSEEKSGEKVSKKPVISIVSIAHLNEQERMFFVTILLNEMVSWMRNQGGTSSLRAIFYMDEVFGYFPPVKNPPTKKPMLTLLKQARAYGLGCVLATQNPVDLDYKGLSNTGTWFLGRLQTERDKARVLEGLEGASTQAGSNFDRGKMEKTLAALGSRVFLMNNVHSDEPTIFETRWVMSYLRGPLSRQELRKLPGNSTTISDAPDPTSDHESSSEEVENRSQAIQQDNQLESPANSSTSDQSRPSHTYVRPDIKGLDDTQLIFKAAILGTGSVHFRDRDYGIEIDRETTLVANFIHRESNNQIWSTAIRLQQDLDRSHERPSRSSYGPPPSEFENPQQLSKLESEFEEFLNLNETLQVWNCKELKLYSEPSESLPEFAERVKLGFGSQSEEVLQQLKKLKRGRRWKTLKYWSQYIVDSIVRLLQRKKTRVIKWSTAESKKVDAEIEKLEAQL